MGERLLLLTLAACGQGFGVGDDSDTTGSSACVVDPSAFPELTALASGMPTVARLSWRDEHPAPTRITAMTVGEDPLEATLAEGDMLVRGLLPGRTYTLTLERDGWCSAPIDFDTGHLDVPAPAPLVVDRDRLGPGWLVVTTSTDPVHYATVLDFAGRPVWARLPESGRPFRTAISRDGQAVLVNTQAAAVDQPGAIERYAWDGSLVQTVPVTSGHTDFVELPDGGYAALGWEIRAFGDRKLLGDTIVEVSADGTERVVWRSFDVVPVDLGVQYDKGFYLADPEVEDWSHANGLAYDEDLDVYHVTINLVEAVARVSRESGDTQWVLADATGDFRNTGAGRLVEQPHSVQWLGDGMLVFNRGEGDSACSEAVQLDVDEGSGTARRTWSWATEDCVHVGFLGGAQRTEDGETHIVWSSLGRFDTVGADGALARSLQLPAGGTFGFGERVDSLY